MNALLVIEAELQQLGYASGAIIRDYTFADVLSSDGEPRRVELAAFTQVPESYRSAAFGVVREEDEQTLSEHRALGAPILFSIGRQDVGVWRVGAQGAPSLLERVSLDALPDLFRRNAERWRPQAVHRAKSLGQAQASYQLDFVDLGLIQPTPKLTPVIVGLCVSKDNCRIQRCRAIPSISSSKARNPMAALDIIKKSGPRESDWTELLSNRSRGIFTEARHN
jgi:hypothetical protein